MLLECIQIFNNETKFANGMNTNRRYLRVGDQWRCKEIFRLRFSSSLVGAVCIGVGVGALVGVACIWILRARALNLH